MPALDPYAPPQAAAEAAAGVPGAWIKYVYAAMACVRAGLQGALYLPLDAGADYMRLIDPVFRLLGFACSALGLLWIHAAFRHVNQLWLAAGQLPRAGTTPGAAVWRFFVPIYNFYWMFAVHVQLGRAIEGLGREREGRALLGVGVVGSALQLGTGLLMRVDTGVLATGMVLVLPAVWFVYMLHGDRARGPR